MTKLEQKLDELGYKKQKKYWSPFIDKNVKECWKGNICIIIDRDTNKVIENASYVYARLIECYSQQEINNLQQAFNTMKKDLEVLKQCQS